MAKNDEIFDLLLIEERVETHANGGNSKTLFHQVTPFWMTRDGDGFTGQLPFDLKRGDRLLLKRRGSGRR